jgi:hypothetical protein
MRNFECGEFGWPHIRMRGAAAALPPQYYQHALELVVFFCEYLLAVALE